MLYRPCCMAAYGERLIARNERNDHNGLWSPELIYASLHADESHKVTEQAIAKDAWTARTWEARVPAELLEEQMSQSLRPPLVHGSRLRGARAGRKRWRILSRRSRD